MILEVISIIMAGIETAEKVTRIIKNIQDVSDIKSRSQLQESIDIIQDRVDSLEKEINNPQKNISLLLDSYSILVDALKKDNNYSSHIIIIPTEYSTLKILRKKNTILRDPQGEY